MVSKSMLFFLPVYIVQVYGLAWDTFLLPIGWDTYGGKFKYLTFINMVGIQLVSTVNNVFGAA
jgi:hypothetical protein